MSTNFFSNMNVIPQLVGLEALLSPFAANTSSQRLAMLSSHANQALVLYGNEHPRISSGFEGMIGQYEVNRTERDQDITIIEVIPKYIPGQGAFPIRENPYTTVIYRGHSDGLVGYFNLDKYTKCADGFGYKNKLFNESFLSKDNYVPQDMKFMTSPTHHGEFYGMGVNTNVAYISLDGVTEDAFIISDELAAKMNSCAIKELSFKVAPDQIPLNLYGDDNEYRFMPDIGEKVRQDGIICCFRKPTVSTFISDIMNDSLVIPQPLHDTTYMVPYAGATVIDIDIDINRQCRNKISKEIYGQVYKYKDNNNIYHKRIVDAYKEVVSKGWQISPAFNTLVYRSMVQLMAENKPMPGINLRRGNVTLMKKKDPIEFLNITITYQFDNVVSKGYKIVGRDGNKGVVSEIKEKSKMPTDIYGFTADVAMDGTGVLNRMNPGQVYEQFITRTDEFVRSRVIELMTGSIPPGIDPTKPGLENITPNPMGAWNYFITYMYDINPNFGKIVDDCHPNDESKMHMLNEIREDGIYQVIPPFSKHIDSSWVMFISDKYPAPTSPVAFTITDSKGMDKVVTTVDPICIGSTYKYLLYKIPKIKSSGVGYINQHRTPVMPSPSAKQQYPVSQTTLRIGEDEVRNILMVAGPSTVSRFLGLHANSTDAVETMIRMQLTEKKPTAIKRIPMSTREVINTNNIAKMARHLMSTCGIDYAGRIKKESVNYENLTFTETDTIIAD